MKICYDYEVWIILNNIQIFVSQGLVQKISCEVKGTLESSLIHSCKFLIPSIGLLLFHALSKSSCRLITAFLIQWFYTICIHGNISVLTFNFFKFWVRFHHYEGNNSLIKIWYIHISCPYKLNFSCMLHISLTHT